MAFGWGEVTFIPAYAVGELKHPSTEIPWPYKSGCTQGTNPRIAAGLSG